MPPRSGEGVHAFEAADEAHLPLMSKPTSYEIADRAGVRRPWSAFVNTPEQLAAAARDATYPCIMKPALSHEWRALFGDDRVILADGPEELVRESERALEARLEIIVSEYVPGGDDCVEEAILVRASDGSYPVWLRLQEAQAAPGGLRGRLAVHLGADPRVDGARAAAAGRSRLRGGGRSRDQASRRDGRVSS